MVSSQKLSAKDVETTKHETLTPIFRQTMNMHLMLETLFDTFTMFCRYFPVRDTVLQWQSMMIMMMMIIIISFRKQHISKQKQKTAPTNISYKTCSANPGYSFFPSGQ